MKKKDIRKMKKSTVTKDDKRQILLVVVLALIAIVMLFVTVNIFNSESVPGVDEPTLSIEDNNNIVSTTINNAQPVQGTTVGNKPAVAPSQSVSQTAESSTAPTESNKNEKPLVVDEKVEILKKVTDGVNALKASDASFKGTKSQIIDMELLDCSVSWFVAPLNKFLDVFCEETVFEYDFTNGVAFDPEDEVDISASDAFPPSGKPFSLTADGVAKAYTEKDGENTVYTVVLVAETSTIENSRPVHHNSACDTFDLTMIEIPIATITKADYNYPGATVSVTYSPDGKVVGYYEKMELDGVGEGEAYGLSASVVIDGFIEERWTIEWK